MKKNFSFIILILSVSILHAAQDNPFLRLHATQDNPFLRACAQKNTVVSIVKDRALSAAEKIKQLSDQITEQGVDLGDSLMCRDPLYEAWHLSDPTIFHWLLDHGIFLRSEEDPGTLINPLACLFITSNSMGHLEPRDPLEPEKVCTELIAYGVDTRCSALINVVLDSPLNDEHTANVLKLLLVSGAAPYQDLQQAARNSRGLFKDHYFCKTIIKDPQSFLISDKATTVRNEICKKLLEHNDRLKPRRDAIARVLESNTLQSPGNSHWSPPLTNLVCLYARALLLEPPALQGILKPHDSLVIAPGGPGRDRSRKEKKDQ